VIALRPALDRPPDPSSSSRPADLSPRETAIKEALDAVRARCDVPTRLAADPVSIAHGFDDPVDRELVALATACIAFGNAKIIVAKAGELVARLGPHPAAVAESRATVEARLKGWKHRVFRGEDLARLLWGARSLQRQHGSLGALFEAELDRQGTVREALAVWCDALRLASGLNSPNSGVRLRRAKRHPPRRRGPAHLLPDPRGPSGTKRLLLFLRWMIRPADGVDLGLWDVDPARLLIPVDVHIHRLARNLGLTRRASPSFRTTEEITAALARFDPSDPVGYDFALCHMGMLQGCPSRRDAGRCAGCGVKAVCIHWAQKGRLVK
jgi:uncharacterized protein (TIGR02757 family)